MRQDFLLATASQAANGPLCTSQNDALPPTLAFARWVPAPPAPGCDQGRRRGCQADGHAAALGFDGPGPVSRVVVIGFASSPLVFLARGRPVWSRAGAANRCFMSPNCFRRSSMSQAPRKCRSRRVYLIYLCGLVRCHSLEATGEMMMMGERGMRAEAQRPVGVYPRPRGLRAGARVQ